MKAAATRLFHALVPILLALLASDTCVFVHPAAAQRIALDSTAGKKAGLVQPRAKRPGFDLPDSLYHAVDSVKGQIDTIIYYTAQDSVVFNVPKKTVVMIGDATLDYENKSLRAHGIMVDFPTNTLTATSSAADSVIQSSIAHQRRILRDTARIKSRGAPKLMDGNTPYEGEILTYNLQTRQGTVQLGTTEMQGGFYYGEKIKQVDQGVLFVKNGRYTTCDAPTPHFYFESPKMKVISGDQVFAEPLYLYIADVPIFALPFAVFPEHETGRHSGLIVPNYTTQNARGFGLTHLGYYVVFSDYMDIAFRSDLYTKGGYNLELATNYMQRYVLNAPINLTLAYGKARSNSVDPYTEAYRLDFSVPNLQIDPVSQFNSSVHFQSQNYQQYNATNINDLLNQSLTSQAAFSTSFEKLGVSLGVNYSRNQNLITGEYGETSPSLNLSRSTPIFLFGGGDNPEASSGVLQTVAVNFGLSMSRSVNKSLLRIPTDTSRGIVGDTSFVTKQSYSALLSPSLTISPKVGYISFTPSVSLSEAFFIRDKIKTPRLVINTYNGKSDTTLTFDQTYKYGFYGAGNVNFGLSAATTLFGILNLDALGVKAIRHAFQPSISFNYHPDVSKQASRYYTDPITGKEIRYSRFEDDGNGTIADGGRSGTVSLSLGNDFEAKIEHKISADSSWEEKVKLLNLSGSSGYDLIQKRWSPVSASANTQIGTLFSLGGNASFSLYPANYLGGDSTGGHTFRMTSASFHMGGGFSSSQTTSGENYDSLKRLFHLNSPDEERSMFLGGQYQGAFVYVPFRPKWNLSYDFSYTLGYAGPIVSKNFSANARLSVSLTQNWSLSSGIGYDLQSKQITVPDITIHRDLHCWELNFDYRPVGYVRGFNFEIRLKAPQLQDIKLTRQESTYGTF